MSRGPAYPYINLGDAIALTRKLFDFSKRSPANLNSVLKDKWGYSPTSSSAVKIVAALKYFGLADVVAGATKEQPDSIRITERAYRILIDSESSPERAKALRDACLSPKAYKLCWDTWGADMPEAMKSTLIFSHGFNDASVGTFLTNYKKSVQFAGLLGGDDEKGRVDERLSAKNGAIRVGDFVQWEHNGVLGLPKALKLEKLSDDGSYGWVEGHTTGLPIAELVKAEAPALPPPPPPPADDGASRGGQGHNSPTPEHRRLPPKGVGMRQEVFSLAEGDVTIQWPERISQESLQDFNDWLVILKRKVERNVSKSEPPSPPADMQPSQ